MNNKVKNRRYLSTGYGTNPNISCVFEVVETGLMTMEGPFPAVI
jgi:hypothetical protein